MREGVRFWGKVSWEVSWRVMRGFRVGSKFNSRFCLVFWRASDWMSNAWTQPEFGVRTHLARNRVSWPEPAVASMTVIPGLKKSFQMRWAKCV